MNRHRQSRKHGQGHGHAHIHVPACVRTSLIHCRLHFQLLASLLACSLARSFEYFPSVNMRTTDARHECAPARRMQVRPCPLPSPLASALVLRLCRSEAALAKLGVTVERDVAYGQGNRCLLDVYAPAAASKGVSPCRSGCSLCIPSRGKRRGLCAVPVVQARACGYGSRL
eukprot:318365-Chlamydomonas_euryale.AAC.12